MPTSYPLFTAIEEEELLADIKARAMAGYEVLRTEPAWAGIQDAQDAINGKNRYERTKTLSSTSANRLRKISNTHSALLTDVRPIWSYNTFNEKVRKQSEVLNKCSRAWWKKMKVDRTIKGALDFSGIGATGYLYATWDKDQKDIRTDVLDPRDVIPIEPVQTDSIQDWRGVVVRQRMPLREAKRMWPDKAHLFRDANGGWFGIETGRGRTGILKRFTTYFWEGSGNASRFDVSPGCEIYRTYLKDNTLNSTGEELFVGEPGTNWGYTVKYMGQQVPDGQDEQGQPKTREATDEECMLWPRGKLIISTADAIISVLPNPYWHGKFPVVAFKLFPCSWTLLGLSIIQDLMPLQHSLNECIRGLDDARDKINQPGVIADRRAISEANLRKIDSRQSGGHFHVDTTLTGSEGFRNTEPPNMPSYYLQFMQWIEMEMDDLAGIKGIEQLAQLRSLPAQDTVEEFKQAMSPILKDMSRSLACSVTELAELMKFNLLQWYDDKRREEILGEEGLTLADYDPDPSNMIPAEMEGATTEQRAKALASNMHFEIAENSFLNMNNAAKKMLDFQLWSRNGLDLYSMWKSMDIQEIGQAPAENVQDRMIFYRRNGLAEGPTPELVQAQQAAALMQAQMTMMQMQMQMQTPTNSPQPGQPPTNGAPPAPDGGGGAPPAGGGDPGAQPSKPEGRPPSMQVAPHLESKNGGMRSTISTS